MSSRRCSRSALRAFGEFADLKSASTVGHSLRVADLAAGAAERVGLSAVQLRRAGWLHDVGRVGVSSAVWVGAALAPGAVRVGGSRCGCTPNYTEASHGSGPASTVVVTPGNATTHY